MVTCLVTLLVILTLIAGGVSIWAIRLNSDLDVALRSNRSHRTELDHVPYDWARAAYLMNKLTCGIEKLSRNMVPTKANIRDMREYVKAISVAIDESDYSIVEQVTKPVREGTER